MPYVIFADPITSVGLMLKSSRTSKFGYILESLNGVTSYISVDRFNTYDLELFTDSANINSDSLCYEAVFCIHWVFLIWRMERGGSDNLGTLKFRIFFFCHGFRYLKRGVQTENSRCITHWQHTSWHLCIRFRLHRVMHLVRILALQVLVHTT